MTASPPKPDPSQVEYHIVDAGDRSAVDLWARLHDVIDGGWETVNPGFSCQIGTGRNAKGKKMPLVIAVEFERIGGHLVAFAYGCSQLVDHVAISEWCKQNFPNSKGSTNPANFHLCLGTLGIQVRRGV